MNNKAMKLENKKFLFSLLITTSEQISQADSISDLFIFLLRYSFMLNDATNTKNSCASKTPQLNAPQGNIYMGARYLDPKYSRWLSVDPALGEYIPGAGKSDEADKLPGMGGVFNSVNLSLFHYAGNNPVKYTDPTGMAAGVPFERPEDAAIDWAKTYGDDSIYYSREYGSTIYSYVDGSGKKKYSYNIPNMGEKNTCDINTALEPGQESVHAIHSHGGLKDEFWDRRPSGDDKEGCKKMGHEYEFIVSPTGEIIKFNKDGIIGTLAIDDDIRCYIEDPWMRPSDRERSRQFYLELFHADICYDEGHLVPHGRLLNTPPTWR